MSAGVIALGCLVSPARLVNDCEYTAERALSNGSSDGAMPAGNTKGSKLRSVAALVSSLSTRSSVRVPTSTFSRSSGQAIVASANDDDETPSQRLAVYLCDQRVEEI